MLCTKTMDFADKIKAARAILDLSQSALAEAAELSVPGIQRLEAKETSPNTRTQDKLIRALKKRGIVFTEKGIEYEQYPIYFTEGKDHEDAYLKLLEDAYEHLLTVKDPELLIMFADDKVSPPSVNDMYRKMRENGIKMRQFIQEGNDYILGPLEEYRYIPAQYFINRVTLIYGDRIANETADVTKGVIKVDPVNAEIQRNTFNILWQLLEQPQETVSDERF